MATNADTEVKDEVRDDQQVEDDLKALKDDPKEVEEETPAETEETEEEPAKEASDEGDQITEDDSQESFTKKFPNLKGETPEEYAKSLEEAYENSTAEFQKLRQQAPIPEPQAEPTDGAPTSWTELYAQQKLAEEANSAYTELVKEFPQAADQDSPVYQQFVKEVDTLSKTIMASQSRLAPPAELYRKAAVILGWESNSPTQGDELKSKLKEGASVTRTNSATKKTGPSKVTDEEVAMYRKLNPTTEKSDSEIRAELEPHK